MKAPLKPINLVRHTAILIALALTSAPKAHADGKVLLDFGGGISKMLGANSFFGTNPPGFGTSLQWAVQYQLTETYSPVRVFAGINHRYVTATSGTQSFGLTVPYPTLRFAAPIFWVGFGVGPFVWKRNESSSGINGYQLQNGAIAYMGETGFEFLLTPEASLCAYGGLQVVSQGGNLSPKPAMDVGINLRVYFFTRRGTGSSSSGSPADFKGHRYPFGYFK